jgi:hypothetical protein
LQRERGYHETLKGKVCFAPVCISQVSFLPSTRDAVVRSILPVVHGLHDHDNVDC